MNATNAHTVYCVERASTHEVITASRDRNEAKDIGECVAEFEPDERFELVQYTLH